MSGDSDIPSYECLEQDANLGTISSGPMSLMYISACE